MRIKNITLNNFRIYGGLNTIRFFDDDQKNVHIITGYNGYGKTTFLTSLVWCLYGKGMQDVEDTFSKSISESGGYRKFLQASLNKAAKKEGATQFYVEIEIEGVNIPGVHIDNLVVRREFNGEEEQLNIIIDGDFNELVSEVGQEMFIQDFILPREIAKFFFFDAEKITSLAELKKLEDKRKLSRAYSEVLGIKKYEDLRKNLQDVRYRYKKVSATKEDQEKLESYEQELKDFRIELTEAKRVKEESEYTKTQSEQRVDEIQEQLIRQGTSLTNKELDKLRVGKEKLKKESVDLKTRLSEALEMAPFAIMASQLKKALEAAKQEGGETVNEDLLEDLSTKIGVNLDTFLSDKIIKKHAIKNSDELLAAIKSSITSQFKEVSSSDTESRRIIDLDNSELAGLEDLFLNVKHRYNSSFSTLVNDLKINASQNSKSRKALLMAESKEQDQKVVALRASRQNEVELVSEMEDLILSSSVDIDRLTREINSKEKVKSELEKKLGVGEKYIKKNELTERLIAELEELIVKIKLTKKHTLENSIKASLNQLMHKKNFVSRVEVLINEDLIDIELYDSREDKIDKRDLSKGEQQLYATSILKALVDESNIQFPVFVDSPLQKFDKQHAFNVINDFYPNISKQVVILPLLEKELNEKEFNVLEKYVYDVYLIENIDDNRSHFVKADRSMLFKEEIIAA